MFLEDITQEYLDSITNDILYRKDYAPQPDQPERQIANFTLLPDEGTSLERTEKLSL